MKSFFSIWDTFINFDWVNIILTVIQGTLSYYILPPMAYTFKGQVNMFAGRVKIVSAILKYFCPRYPIQQFFSQVMQFPGLNQFSRKYALFNDTTPHYLREVNL